VERLAQNLNDSARYQLADREGLVLQDKPTVPGGPVVYYTTVPLRAMVTALRRAGIPADISDTPGTNLCNHLLYGILHYVAVNNLPIRTGWVHLPFLPVTAALDHNLGAPSMSLETSVAGVKTAIHAVLDNPHDIKEPVLSRWQI
jgi:pyroglutamyl-peptidase